jgi:uncharacterized membrane protein
MDPPRSPALAEQLRRWRQAGLIDAPTAEAIAAFEARPGTSQAAEAPPGRSWSLPERLFLALGGVLLAAGLLLFISAHWPGISPAGRFALVLSLVVALHALGAQAGRRASPALASTLHGVGTVAFGAGIYLTGQIFHLAAHWPRGLLLWGLGAGAGWCLLRQWPQLALLAILLPAWLAAEWLNLSDHLLQGPLFAAMHGAGQGHAAIEMLLTQVLAGGVLLLSLAWLGAAHGLRTSAARRVLVGLGGLALGPASVAWAITTGDTPASPASLSGAVIRLLASGWVVALGGPLLLSWWLRGRAFWPLAVAVPWLLVSAVAPFDRWAALRLAWWALGGVLLALWGARDGRTERVNLGLGVVAIALIAYSFSEIFDKLGRSMSLIVLGTLFLLGGWLLERWRRKLVERIRRQAPSLMNGPP